MRVLVVGSEGFLGGWVKKLLLEDNEHELIEIRGKNDLNIGLAIKINVLTARRVLLTVLQLLTKVYFFLCHI